eukprot:gene28867-37878_t
MDLRAEIASLQTDMLCTSRNEDKLHFWNLLIRITIKYTNKVSSKFSETTCEKEENDSLHSDLQNLWFLFIGNSRLLSSIWVSIFRLHLTNRLDAIAQSKSFFNGYRIVFNCFMADTDDAFECNRYTRTLLTALVATSIAEYKHFVQSAMDILSEQSDQVHYMWMRYCCTISDDNNNNENDKRITFLRASSPTFATHLLLIAVKIFDKTATTKHSRAVVKTATKNDNDSNSSGTNNTATTTTTMDWWRSILQCLASTALPYGINDPGDIEELIVAMFLRESSPSLRSQPLTAVLVDALIAAIATSATPLIATMQVVVPVARLWGHKMFVLASGQGSRQVYLTRVILLCLKREEVDAAAVMETPLAVYGVRTPLALLLSMGVSIYMDSSDNLTRTNGMKVARCYAKIVGHTLQFEGLEDDGDDDCEGIEPGNLPQSAESPDKNRSEPPFPSPEG